jgi:hypothetical protein
LTRPQEGDGGSPQPKFASLTSKSQPSAWVVAIPNKLSKTTRYAAATQQLELMKYLLGGLQRNTQHLSHCLEMCV